MYNAFSQYVVGWIYICKYMMVGMTAYIYIRSFGVHRTTIKTILLCSVEFIQMMKKMWI